jgi:hypothetical protein
MSATITDPQRTTGRLDSEAQLMARFECHHLEHGYLAGWSEVHRVPLNEPDTGRMITTGYIIRWQWAGEQIWEQTTLDGQAALKEGANKWGWGL